MLDPAAFKYRLFCDCKQDMSNSLKSRLVSHMHSFVLCADNLFVVSVPCKCWNLTIPESRCVDLTEVFPLLTSITELALDSIETWKWNLFYSCWFVLSGHEQQKRSRLFCTSGNKEAEHAFATALPRGTYLLHWNPIICPHFPYSVSEDQRNLQARLNFILKIKVKTWGQGTYGMALA